VDFLDDAFEALLDGLVDKVGDFGFHVGEARTCLSGFGFV
jgi:hypothetical protein